MNDDQIDALLADLGTDVPEMSDKAFEAGRTRLQAKVSPEPVVTVLERDVAVVPLPKRRLLRSPPRKLVMPVAAAAAAMALAAGVLVVQAARTDRAATPAESAATQLNLIADKINPVVEMIPSDQYRYRALHTWGMYLGSTDKSGEPRRNALDLKVMVETVDEKWMPADPAQPCSFRFTMTNNYKWVEGNAEQAQEVGFHLPDPTSNEFTNSCDDDDLWWGAPSPEELASLPRDPGQLNDRLRDDAQRTRVWLTPDITLVESVTNLLLSGMVPADLRAALYRTLALTPGLEVTEHVDLDGIKGTAFGVSGEGQRHEVIIDSTTGQFIGLRWTHLADHKQTAPDAAWANTDQPPSVLASVTPSKDMVVAYVTMTNPVIVDRVGETS